MSGKSNIFFKYGSKYERVGEEVKCSNKLALNLYIPVKVNTVQFVIELNSLNENCPKRKSLKKPFCYSWRDSILGPPVFLHHYARKHFTSGEVL